MSEVLGFLTLAAVALLICVWLIRHIHADRLDRALTGIERIAYREYRSRVPVDRVAVVSALVGPPNVTPPPPVFARRVTSEDDELDDVARRHLAERANDTRRSIGAVRLAEAMRPCDEVVGRSVFYTARDFGDESPAF